MEAIIIKEWALCPECGCKLAKINQNTKSKDLEIKCHQCKQIVKVNIDKRK